MSDHVCSWPFNTTKGASKSEMAILNQKDFQFSDGFVVMTITMACKSNPATPVFSGSAFGDY